MLKNMFDPEIGFTSDVVRDPDRFVGRTDDIRDCITALNTSLGLIAVYGKRGVGKSSLLRQVQQMATGDYSLAKRAGLSHLIPKNPRKYLTIFYTCDSSINDSESLLRRLCNDQDDEDGLLRLVPNDGKEITEFSRSKAVNAGTDLKVVQWGVSGVETSKYARVVPNDTVQTFRNFINAVEVHQVRRMKYNGILILLDEFDVIKNRANLGSLVKSLSSDSVKFAVCGIGKDINELVEDHASVERLLESGSIFVRPMHSEESKEIVHTAERLFRNKVTFDEPVAEGIAEISQGYPYLTQLIGKTCITVANETSKSHVTSEIFAEVRERIRSGRAFPTLERSYKQAIGDSDGRQTLLHLLAEQKEELSDFRGMQGQVYLKKVRVEAQDFEVDHIDQLVPRLVDQKYGPVLTKVDNGVYEFVNPVFRVYVTLRHL